MTVKRKLIAPDKIAFCSKNNTVRFFFFVFSDFYISLFRPNA